MNTQNIRQLRICCVFNWTVVGRRLATAASTFSLFSFDFLLSLAFFSPSIYIAGHFCPKVHDMNAVAVVCAGIDGLLVCECLTSSIQLRSRWYSHNLFYATQTVKYNILLIYSISRIYSKERFLFVRPFVRIRSDCDFLLFGYFDFCCFHFSLFLIFDLSMFLYRSPAVALSKGAQMCVFSSVLFFSYFCFLFCNKMLESTYTRSIFIGTQVNTN